MFNIYTKKSENAKPISVFLPSSGEYAWRIADAASILNHRFSKRAIILGGDILTLNLDYTYDSWYYDPDEQKSHGENAEISYHIAKDYLEKYILCNGKNFLFTLVVK